MILNLHIKQVKGVGHRVFFEQLPSCEHHSVRVTGHGFRPVKDLQSASLYMYVYVLQPG